MECAIPDDLLRFRHEFPILETCSYLVSHSLGALSTRAREGLHTFEKAWDERGVRAWRESWWDLPNRLGCDLERILGAEAGSISIQPNVTVATAVWLSAIDFPPERNRLVTTDLEFPSLLYLFEGIQGAEVVRVESEDGVRVDLGALLEAIDEKTQVVALSHVLFRSSFIQDIEAITTRAHHVGARVLIDTYQSAGVVPIDLPTLGVDAAVGGTLKWLLGGPGVAFLYVRPDQIESLEPKLAGWFSHADPFSFATESIDRANDARRFMTGTTPIPSIHAALGGLSIIEEATIAEIRAKSLRLTRRILDRCEREGWEVGSPLEDRERGGIVTLAPPHSYGCSQALLENDVIVDYRPGAGIRIAPHLYNREDEIDSALDLLATILNEEGWRPFEGRDRERVT